MKKGKVLLMMLLVIAYMTCIVSHINTDIHYVAKSYVSETNTTNLKSETDIAMNINCADIAMSIDYTDIAMSIDYADLMIQAVIDKDIETGKQLEIERNNKIDRLELSNIKFSFEDLFYLSACMVNEAGSDWLPDDWALCVGNVLINRKDSIEFDNTIVECLFAEGQYYISDESIARYDIPRRIVLLAIRLLEGERLLPPYVVFQCESKYEGSSVYLEMEDPLGFYSPTYFAVSNYPEKYE